MTEGVSVRPSVKSDLEKKLYEMPNVLGLESRHDSHHRGSLAHTNGNGISNGHGAGVTATYPGPSRAGRTSTGVSSAASSHHSPLDELFDPCAFPAHRQAGQSLPMRNTLGVAHTAVDQSHPSLPNTPSAARVLDTTPWPPFTGVANTSVELSHSHSLHLPATSAAVGRFSPLPEHSQRR
eukprot:m.158320 g.158320  ORF g.158320 m.158320 type:complete len:180 (+) comp15168_c9_seq1:273-812(+)